MDATRKFAQSMLFNSALFLTVFLPVTLLGFWMLGRLGRQPAIAWLAAASVVFYASWNPAHALILLGSTFVNWLLGRRLAARPSAALLAASVAGNLLLLGWFKYTGFVVQTVNDATGAGWAVPHIALPLALSFFTFQQIAYLCDSNDGVATEPSLLNYTLFVTFFPHLVAGPITHHKEMVPQFEDDRFHRLQPALLASGATLFLIGLFKKVVVADPMGAYATPGFAAVAAGDAPTLVSAWVLALSYTMQMYFDFSGYTDMAIGLGVMFGISLPPNFNSPFKARSIIEFWSRWHMTLTRFLTAYIYNPLVLRLTRARVAAGLPMPKRGRMTPGAFAMLVAAPTLLTMFLSGLWHGAGWTFIVFGVLHGVFLVVNHGWRALKLAKGWQGGGWLRDTLSVLLTFTCVVVALVVFRAPDLATAGRVLAGMAGLNGVDMDYTLLAIRGVHTLTRLLGIPVLDVPRLDLSQVLVVVLLLAAVWMLPNAMQWMRLTRTALMAQPPAPHWTQLRWPGSAFTWRPRVAVGAALGVAGFIAVAQALSVAPTEFLYFQF
jgi:D-alanyl-lipoteichoic acid acyltransferase DltB (MBOAT superfamily)